MYIFNIKHLFLEFKEFCPLLQKTCKVPCGVQNMNKQHKLFPNISAKKNLIDHNIWVLSLQIAPILAKTTPTFNALLYALGNENYRGGIWQLITGEKIDVPQIENKSK